MRVVPLALLVLLIVAGGCTSDADVDTAASSLAETTEVATAAPTSSEDAPAATEAPGDASGSPQPSDAASPDLSRLDEVVEELGVSPQTVLGVSLTTCAALAEGLDRGEVEQRLRDMEAELSLQELSADQLADVVDAGVEALCPDRA